jgi:WD40 repeat protein
LSKPVLGLLAGLAALAAAGEVRRRGSRDMQEQACTPGVSASLEAALAGMPEGSQPLNKWIDLLQSRGVARQQMQTRGLLAWLEAQRASGRKSLTKSDLLAWSKDNPFGLIVTWKGPPLGGKLTAQQQRVQKERERLMASIKPLLLKKGLSSAEADLVMAKPERHVFKAGDGYLLTLKSLPHDRDVLSIAFSPDGHLVGTTSYSKAQLWRTDGTLVQTLPHSGVVNSIAFSPDGRLVGTANWEKVRLWRTDGTLVKEILHDRNVNSVAFSPDGRLVGTASIDKKARLWRTDGTLVATLPHDNTVYSIAFSPDGRLVGTASDDKKARLWRTDGTLITTLPHDGDVLSIAFSPDGRLVGTTSYSKARLWRTDGTLVETLPHNGSGYSIAFSPDGRLVGTGSIDNKARLWRTDGTLVTTLPHEGYVNSIAFSPDGRLVGTACGAAGSSGNKKARLFAFVDASNRLASDLFALSQISSSSSEPKWSRYVSGQPDGYRELLLRLPPIESRERFNAYSHWDEPDVLAHARITLRGDVLFIDEIQSDWHQGLAGRKEAAAQQFPGGPGRNEPPVPFAQDWERLVLKHLLAYAAQTGIKAVALTDAATIAPVVGGDEKSLSGFYDQRLLNVFGALVKRLGGEVTRVKVKGFRKTFPGVILTPAFRDSLCRGFSYWSKT